MPKRRSVGHRSAAVGPTGARRLAATLLQLSVPAAVAIVPLYFNPGTERVFEPDKLAWLQLIALICAWALLVLWSEARLAHKGALAGKADGRAAHERTGHPARAWHGLSETLSPVGIAVLAAALALAIGALFSIAQTTSFWGAYRRGFGVVVYIAYLLVFAAAHVTLRRPGALDLLRYSIVVPAVPVALYAVLQSKGMDSVPWEVYGASAAQRAFGPLGNPIFLGAYLIMVLPVAVGWIIEAALRLRAGKAASLPALATLCAAVGLMLWALAATQSRGPVVGLLVGAATFTLLLAARLRLRSGAMLIVGLCIAGVLALVAIGSHGEGGASRMQTVLSASSRTARQRLLVWDTLGRLMVEDPGRAVVGYGPDTLVYVLARHVPKELARLTPDRAFDRAHNSLWEWWVAAGLLGAAALAGLYCAAFYVGARALGLVTCWRDRLRLYAGLLGGVAVGVSGPLALNAPAYGAVGAALGLVAGYSAFLVYSACAGPAAGRQAAGAAEGRRVGAAVESAGARRWTVLRTLAHGPDLLVIAALSGLSAHLAESSFGLPTAAGELLFWAYLAVVAVAWRTSEVERTAAGAPAADVARGTAGALGLGVLDGLVLSAIAFAPLLQPSPGASFGTPALWLLLPATWFVMDALAARGGGGRGNSGWRWTLTLTRVAVLGAFLILLLAFRGTVGGAVLAYGVLLSGGVLGAALWVTRLKGSLGRPGWRTPAYAGLAVVLSLLAWRVVLAPIIADANVRVGLEAGMAGDIRGARRYFERATQLWPEQTAYATYLAAAERDVYINTNSSDAAREHAFQSAVNVLTRALDQVPDDALAFRLATLYRDRGDLSADPTTSLAAWRTASQYYETALSLYPMSAQTLSELGALLERLEQPDQAAERYAAALDIDPTHLGAEAGLVRASLAAGDFEGAVDALERAIAVDPGRADELGRLLEEAMGWPIDEVAAREALILFRAANGEPVRARRHLDEMKEEGLGGDMLRLVEDWIGRAGGRAPKGP